MFPKDIRYRICVLSNILLKVVLLAKLFAEILFRFQWQMVKWLIKLHLGSGVISISSLKISFREKQTNKKCENKYSNKYSFNLSKSWKKKYLFVLNTKIPKDNDRKNIYMIVKML